MSVAASINTRKTPTTTQTRTPTPISKSKLTEYIALFDFNAEADDELTFRKNDIIIYMNDDEDKEWMWGKLKNDSTNRKGIFPKNMVKLHTKKMSAASSSKGTSDQINAKATMLKAEGKSLSKEYAAIFSFEAENEDELGFKEGEVINNVKVDSEEWWFGTVKNQPKRHGLFPSAYVKEVVQIKSTINKINRITTTPEVSVKNMSIKEACQEKETSIEKANEIAKKYKCSPNAVTSCVKHIEQSTTVTEREALLESLSNGYSGEEIDELASQARQMLMLVDNAIKQKSIPEKELISNNSSNKNNANNVLNTLGALDLTETVANTMKLYEQKQEEEKKLIQEEMKRHSKIIKEVKLQQQQQQEQQPKPKQQQRVELKEATVLEKIMPTIKKEKLITSKLQNDDPSKWKLDKDPLDLKYPEDDSIIKATDLQRDTKGRKNNYIDNVKEIINRTPTPTPSIPTPSPSPQSRSPSSLQKKQSKKVVRRHASIVFIIGEPGTRDFKKEYQNRIFSKFISDKTGCLHISLTKSVKETLANKGPIAKDIMKCVLSQKNVSRNVILKVLFRDIRKAIDLFDNNPNRFQSKSNFYGSPTKIKYYDFIIDGFPCELEDMTLFRTIATALFSDGIDWRVAYLKSPNPRNVERKRLRKHQWNSLSRGRVEEAKDVLKQQQAFRKRIQTFHKYCKQRAPDNNGNIKHIAKGSKIGGKAKEMSKTFLLQDLPVKEIIKKLAMYIAGYTDTLDRKLENTPDGFVNEYLHQRGVQTSMSELPPKSKLMRPKYQIQNEKRKKRVQLEKGRKEFEPFVRGGSPVHLKVKQKDVRIDGKIRPRKRRFPYKGKRAQTVNTSKEKFTNNNVIIVEERNIHTAPSSLTLTEELWRWLRSLKLGSWSRIEEPEWWRHAFSNGYVFADILAHYFPRGIQTHTFDPLGVSSYSKRDNWGLLMKFFKKHRINLIAPEKLLPSDYKNSVSIRKSLRSNRFLCEAAMLATPNATLLVLKGIYFFLLNLGLVPPMQNIYIPVNTPTPAPTSEKKEDYTIEKQMADKLIHAIGILKHALQKNAHGKTHVDLRGFQGRKLTPDEFKSQLRTQLGLKLSKIEHELIYLFFDRDGDGSIDYVEVMHKFLHVHRMEVKSADAFQIASTWVKKNGVVKNQNAFVDYTRKNGTIDMNRNDNNYSNASTLPPPIPRGTPTKPSFHIIKRQPNELGNNNTNIKMNVNIRKSKPKKRQIGYRKMKDGQRILIKPGPSKTVSNLQQEPTPVPPPPPPPAFSPPYHEQQQHYHQKQTQFQQQQNYYSDQQSSHLQNDLNRNVINNQLDDNFQYYDTEPESSADTSYDSGTSSSLSYYNHSQTPMSNRSGQEYITSDFNVQKLQPANVYKPEPSTDWMQRSNTELY